MGGLSFPLRALYPGNPNSLSFADQAAQIEEALHGLVGSSKVLMGWWSNGCAVTQSGANQFPHRSSGQIQIAPVAIKHWDGQPDGAPEPATVEASLAQDSIWQQMQGESPFVALLLGWAYHNLVDLIPDYFLAFQIIEPLQYGWGSWRMFWEATFLRFSPQLMKYADNIIITSFGDFGLKLAAYQLDVANNLALGSTVAAIPNDCIVFHCASDGYIVEAQPDAVVAAVNGQVTKVVLSKSHHAPWISKDHNTFRNQVLAFANNHIPLTSSWEM